MLQIESKLKLKGVGSIVLATVCFSVYCQTILPALFLCKSFSVIISCYSNQHGHEYEGDIAFHI